MAAARVIHFGVDECHRLMVLQSAGYSVNDCGSLAQLRDALGPDNSVDGVFVTEDDRTPTLGAVSLVKSCSSAPLILFRRSHGECEEESFDLVIETLTPPRRWLVEVEQLIARSRALRSRSQEIFGESERLRKESAPAGLKSRAERARSRNIRTAGKDLPEQHPGSV